MIEKESSSPSALIGGLAVKRQISARLSAYTLQTVSNGQRAEFEEAGWVVDKKLVRSVRMRKRKTHDVEFEDRVWAMMASLGFKTMNGGRNFVLSYGDGAREGKQIDVVAIDDEVIVAVECKSSAATQSPSSTFKSELEAIRGIREGLIKSLKVDYPNHKVKFVIASNNISVSDEGLDNIEALDVAYLDEEAVDYYLELADQLGVAAKYQLLGNLFQGTKIAGLHPVVPAIQSKMGGYLYYSFAIEPERLLKIAYVLHRSKANNRWMPTYQRVIKKARLKRVASFVESGGFFPNSLVLNIDSGKKLQFDRLSQKDTSTTLGMLHLPQAYRSAYVIDGQHRLYGYANSDRGASELIPVVAFVDLPPQEQVRLFMQINENQQAVPKNLRNTLNSDLLWGSADLRERAKALRLRVAQALGEEKASPLRGRVIVGEDKTTNTRCISIDAINRGIDRGRFVGTFTAAEMKSPGSFFRGDNPTTFKPLTQFLTMCFQHLRDALPDQWTLGRAEGGFVFTNNGVEALIRFLGDVVDFEVAAGHIDPRSEGAQQIFESIRPHIDVVTSFVTGLSAEEGAELKRMYGSAAAGKYWRRFQKALNEARPDFEPEGLAEYIEDEGKLFDADISIIAADIERYIRADVKRRLEDRFGSVWYKDAVPQRIYQQAQATAAERNWNLEEGSEVDWWDCVSFADLQKVITYRQEIWSQIFADGYTAPAEQQKSGSWKNKASWVGVAARVQGTAMRGESSTESDYTFLYSIHTWLGLNSGKRPESS